MLTGPGGQYRWVRRACAIGGGGDCGKMGTESIVDKGQPGFSSRHLRSGPSNCRCSTRGQTLIFNSNQDSENKTETLGA